MLLSLELKYAKKLQFNSIYNSNTPITGKLNSDIFQGRINYSPQRDRRLWCVGGVGGGGVAPTPDFEEFSQKTHEIQEKFGRP